jgi:hypothetical protein
VAASRDTGDFSNVGDIETLVARGLDRYRAGDVDGALTAWEAALAADPTDPRALGYVDYVRQNYDELQGGALPAELLIPFGLARGDEEEDDEYEVSITESADNDAGVPDVATGSFTKLDPTSERTMHGARAGAVAWAPKTPDPAPEPSIDDGWGLDAESERTWFTERTTKALAFAKEAAAVAGAAASAAVDEPTHGGKTWGEVGDDERTRDFQHASMSFPPDAMLEPAFDPAVDPPSGEATAEHGRAPTLDFGQEFTGERTTERATAKISNEMLMSLGVAPVAERRAGSEELTTEAWPHATGFDVAAPAARPDADAGAGAGAGVGAGSVDLPMPPGGEPVVEPLPPPTEKFDDQGTADLKIRIVRAAVEDDRRPVPIEDLHLPPPRSSTNAIDDESREELSEQNDRALSADEDITARLSKEIDKGAPARETADERTKRRISALLERARSAADKEDHSTAVAAIDLALSEAPDVAAAQKLVHRSRDLILDCYYRFFGRLDKVPVLSAPLAELTRRPLDTRAAFLLSRIDGTLTFEEILDVAGMGRLEACRHLAHLLWRGIISV